MVRNGEIGLAQAKRTLRRYWWILPLSTFLLGGMGLGATFVLHKRYTSQTMVLVVQPTVGPDYVKPVVTEDLNHRLASMKEQILSRTRLQPIIEKFGLYAEVRSRVHIEDLVARLRMAVEIKPLEPTPGTQSRQLPGFYVSVTFDNPKIAQQICTEITSMFLEQNARERKQQANETTSFLSKQLDEAKKNLDDQDAKLAQFKQQYLGSLPEQEQSNLSILTGMNAQLEANTQALSRAHQDKAFNESLIGQQEATWKASQTGQNTETTEQQLGALQEQLTSLQARYTSEHPDVVKLRGQIEELEKRMAGGPKNNPSVNGSRQASAAEPPQIQQLRARLRQVDMNIADLTERQGQIQDGIRQLQGRVQASPMVEQQSEQFRVYDPPSLPDRPSFPKKVYFAGGGLSGGLALALALLYLIAIGDKSMHTERDVELALKLPVLALVPVLEALSPGSEAPKKQPSL